MKKDHPVQPHGIHTPSKKKYPSECLLHSSSPLPSLVVGKKKSRWLVKASRRASSSVPRRKRAQKRRYRRYPRKTKGSHTFGIAWVMREREKERERKGESETEWRRRETSPLSSPLPLHPIHGHQPSSVRGAPTIVAHRQLSGHVVISATTERGYVSGRGAR